MFMLINKFHGESIVLGLTWAEAKKRCPEKVVPACHNSIDTVTISGPKEAVDAFVEELKAEGVFAKVVNSAGVAFHSHYMAKTAPQLQKALLEVHRSKHRLCESEDKIKIFHEWQLLSMFLGYQRTSRTIQ